MRICPKCNKNEQETEFTSKARYCKCCVKDYNRTYLSKKGAKEKFIPVVTDTHKQCCKCKKMILLDNFSPSKRGRLGKSAYCKPCNSEYQLSKVSKEVRRAKTQKYRDENREWWRSLHRINQFNRRNKIKLTKDETVTPEFVKMCLNKEECYYCKENTPKKFRTLEHKLPLSRGGKHTADNITMACSSCNFSKQNKTEEEFEKYRNENTDFSSNSCGLD